MTEIRPDASLYTLLRGAVVVVTGGSTGIGQAAVRQFAAHGAKVAFGDVSIAAGTALQAELGDAAAVFVPCDVSRYDHQLRLFAVATQTFGAVDVVVANAGVSDTDDIFDAAYPLDREPPLRELDVNLKGTVFTAKIGMSYLRQRGRGSLVLVSSIAGFKESTHLTPYLASKHGVIGVLRGLRRSAIHEHIFVNAICPWMTRTAMVAGIEQGWAALGLPENDPGDVATAMLICATANLDPHATHGGARLPFSGKILFVAGGTSYEIEDAMQALEPEWLGRDNSRALRRGQDYLMSPTTSWATGAKPKM